MIDRKELTLPLIKISASPSEKTTKPGVSTADSELKEPNKVLQTNNPGAGNNVGMFTKKAEKVIAKKQAFGFEEDLFNRSFDNSSFRSSSNKKTEHSLSRRGLNRPSHKPSKSCLSNLEF